MTRTRCSAIDFRDCFCASKGKRSADLSGSWASCRLEDEAPNILPFHPSHVFDCEHDPHRPRR